MCVGSPDASPLSQSVCVCLCVCAAMRSGGEEKEGVGGAFMRPLLQSTPAIHRLGILPTCRRGHFRTGEVEGVVDCRKESERWSMDGVRSGRICLEVCVGQGGRCVCVGQGGRCVCRAGR